MSSATETLGVVSQVQTPFVNPVVDPDTAQGILDLTREFLLPHGSPWRDFATVAIRPHRRPDAVGGRHIIGHKACDMLVLKDLHVTTTNGNKPFWTPYLHVVGSQMRGHAPQFEVQRNRFPLYGEIPADVDQDIAQIGQCMDLVNLQGFLNYSGSKKAIKHVTEFYAALPADLGLSRHRFMIDPVDSLLVDGVGESDQPAPTLMIGVYPGEVERLITRTVEFRKSQIDATFPYPSVIGALCKRLINKAPLHIPVDSTLVDIVNSPTAVVLRFRGAAGDYDFPVRPGAHLINLRLGGDYAAQELLGYDMPVIPANWGYEAGEDKTNIRWSDLPRHLGMTIRDYALMTLRREQIADPERGVVWLPYRSVRHAVDETFRALWALDVSSIAPYWCNRFGAYILEPTRMERASDSLHFYRETGFEVASKAAKGGA